MSFSKNIHKNIWSGAAKHTIVNFTQASEGLVMGKVRFWFGIAWVIVWSKTVSLLVKIANKIDRIAPGHWEHLPNGTAAWKADKLYTRYQLDIADLAFAMILAPFAAVGWVMSGAASGTYKAYLDVKKALT